MCAALACWRLRPMLSAGCGAGAWKVLHTYMHASCPACAVQCAWCLQLLGLLMSCLGPEAHMSVAGLAVAEGGGGSMAAEGGGYRSVHCTFRCCYGLSGSLAALAGCGGGGGDGCWLCGRMCRGQEPQPMVG
jgi:hypothetical protein